MERVPATGRVALLVAAGMVLALSACAGSYDRQGCGLVVSEYEAFSAHDIRPVEGGFELRDLVELTLTGGTNDHHWEGVVYVPEDRVEVIHFGADFCGEPEG